VFLGALRGSSIGVLEAQVDQLGRTPCEEVVLDLRHLEHLDHVGAKGLVGFTYYLKGRGVRYRFFGPSSEVVALIASVELASTNPPASGGMPEQMCARATAMA
jgi:anti-anti-sigma regulatory factor